LFFSRPILNDHQCGGALLAAAVGLLMLGNRPTAGSEAAPSIPALVVTIVGRADRPAVPLTLFTTP